MTLPHGHAVPRLSRSEPYLPSTATHCRIGVDRGAALSCTEWWKRADPVAGSTFLRDREPEQGVEPRVQEITDVPRDGVRDASEC